MAIAIWERIDDEHSRCTIHGVTFGRSEAFTIGHCQYVHGQCPDCHRAPKRAPGFLAPSYWSPTTFAGREMLACDFHALTFEHDESCLSCIDEDEDVESDNHIE